MIIFVNTFKSNMSGVLYLFRHWTNADSCTYVIGRTKNRLSIRRNERYFVPRDEIILLFGAQYWIRRRFRMLIARLNEIGCPTDDDYGNDDRTRLICDEFELDWLIKIMFECAKCDKATLAPFKQ